MDSKRRSRIRPEFVIEQLDERVVLSSMTLMPLNHMVQVPAHLGQPEHPGSVMKSALNHASPNARRIGHSHAGHRAPIHRSAIHPVRANHAVTLHQAPISVNPMQPISLSPPPTAPRPTGTVFQSPTTFVPSASGPDLDRLGQVLSEVFTAFEQGGDASAIAVAQANHLQIQGDSVGVDVKTNGNLNQLLGELNGLGMQVETSDASYGIVEGSIQIAQLGDLAALTDVSSVTPVYVPVLNNGGFLVR